MTSSRVQPVVGGAARILHFGGESEPATILEVRDGGRCLLVAGADGLAREFTLRRATARFVARGEQHGPRLELGREAGLPDPASSTRS